MLVKLLTYTPEPDKLVAAAATGFPFAGGSGGVFEKAAFHGTSESYRTRLLHLRH